MLRGTERVQWQCIFAAACYNLIRIPKLAPRWQSQGEIAISNWNYVFGIFRWLPC